MSLYRLEACSSCRVVRVALPSYESVQRAKSGADRPENIGGALIWWVDFCEPCRKAYEEHMKAQEESPR